MRTPAFSPRWKPKHISEIKVGDLGIAFHTASRNSVPGRGVQKFLLPPTAGTPGYRAPEIERGSGAIGSEQNGKEFTVEDMKKCDVYSFGVLLWQMVTRRRCGTAGSPKKCCDEWTRVENAEVCALLTRALDLFYLPPDRQYTRYLGRPERSSVSCLEPSP